MPNISSLTMPDGIVYSIKDSIARKDIEEIKKNGSGGSGGAGGGGTVYATFTQSGSLQSCDKTYAELKAAYDAGKTIVGVFRVGEAIVICPMVYANTEGMDTMVGVQTIVFDATSAKCSLLTVTLIVIAQGAMINTNVSSFQPMTN